MLEPERVRILVVDDSARMRESVREIVESSAFQVVAEARDGQEAVSRFEDHWPDVVLLDLVMPELSGCGALLEMLLRDPVARVVMCSSLGQEALANSALRNGACDVVAKPFDPDRLLTALENAALKPRIPPV